MSCNIFAIVIINIQLIPRTMGARIESNERFNNSCNDLMSNWLIVLKKRKTYYYKFNSIQFIYFTTG